MAGALNPVSVVGSWGICCNADVAVTTTAQNLTAPDHANSVAADGVEEIILQNDTASASPVLVGDGFRQSIVITAGNSLVLPCRNPVNVYVKTGSGTATLHVLYRGQPR